MKHNLPPSFDTDRDEPLINGERTAGIPTELLTDVTAKSLNKWLDPESLKEKQKGEAAGYQLVRSIDGGTIDGREVTLVSIQSGSSYRPHRHFNSDAVFIVISGSATLLSDEPERKVGPGEIIPVPRGMAHGFELSPGEELEWVSIQYPPIHDAETGQEDLHFDDEDPSPLHKLV